MYYANNKIILEMDRMEIMEYHPQNEFSEFEESAISDGFTYKMYMIKAETNGDFDNIVSYK